MTMCLPLQISRPAVHCTCFWEIDLRIHAQTWWYALSTRRNSRAAVHDNPKSSKRNRLAKRSKQHLTAASCWVRSHVACDRTIPCSTAAQRRGETQLHLAGVQLVSYQAQQRLPLHWPSTRNCCTTDECGYGVMKCSGLAESLRWLFFPRELQRLQSQRLSKCEPFLTSCRRSAQEANQESTNACAS